MFLIEQFLALQIIVYQQNCFFFFFVGWQFCIDLCFLFYSIPTKFTLLNINQMLKKEKVKERTKKAVLFVII